MPVGVIRAAIGLGDFEMGVQGDKMLKSPDGSTLAVTGSSMATEGRTCGP
jgi:hypothetical protein